jgi:hypothetical protein
VSERVEAPIIYMGRDSHHYFVPLPRTRDDGTLYIRADLVHDFVDKVMLLLDDLTRQTGDTP